MFRKLVPALALAMFASACQTTRPVAPPPVSTTVEDREEAARIAQRRRQAARKRMIEQRIASESYEAGRQLLRESQPAEALIAFKESARLKSGTPDVWVRIAYACEQTGDKEEAIRAFKKAKQLWAM